MQIIDGIKNRVSVRNYDKNKKVTRNDILTILEAGRLAPNGFGFEHWKFYVIENKLDKLMEASNNQQHIAESSFCVVITSPTQGYIEKNMDEFTDILFKKHYPAEHVNKMMERLGDNKGLYVHNQTYFAASQMVIQAAAMGIGSTIVGGFNNDKVITFLGLDKNQEMVGLVISFGYANSKSEKKYKRDLNDLVIWK